MLGIAVAAAGIGAAVSKLVQPKQYRPPTGLPFAIPGADMLKPEADALAGNIGYHAKFTAASDPLKFETPQAYGAVADSVSERLLERWDATFKAHEEANPKMGYYISMEYLHGRTLANAVRNIADPSAGLGEATLLGGTRVHVPDRRLRQRTGIPSCSRTSVCADNRRKR